MAYAGIQTMLLAYKMRKSDLDFKLIELTQNIVEVNKDKNSLNEYYNKQLSDINQATDNAEYKEIVEEIEGQRQDALAEIMAWETCWEDEKSQTESELAMVNGYIESWSQALQTNIQKAHTYGAQS